MCAAGQYCAKAGCSGEALEHFQRAGGLSSAGLSSRVLAAFEENACLLHQGGAEALTQAQTVLDQHGMHNISSQDALSW